MSLLLEPVIIGNPLIIDLNYNNYKHNMEPLELNGEIIISDTNNENFKLLHIKNYTLHYYCQNVIINNNNNSVVVFLMKVPPPPESKRIEKEPYINNKRVIFDINKFKKIIVLNTCFFGYCDNLECDLDINKKIKEDNKKKNEKIHNIWYNNFITLKKQKKLYENNILLEKAKIHECIIPKNKNMEDTIFGIDFFSTIHNNI